MKGFRAGIIPPVGDEGSWMSETVIEKMAVDVMCLKDQATIDAIRRWSEKEGIDEVTLIDDRKLKTILAFGMREYMKQYPEDQEISLVIRNPKIMGELK